MWVLYQVAMNFQEVFSNFSVLPGQMLQQLEQNAPETCSGIARRRGLLIRNAQRRIILRDAHSDRHTRFVLSSPNSVQQNRPGVRFCTPERFGSFFILDDFLKCLLQRRFDSLRRINRCDHQLVRIYRSEIQIIPRIFCQL